jgi:hypothetical protein
MVLMREMDFERLFMNLSAERGIYAASPSQCQARSKEGDQAHVISPADCKKLRRAG